MPSRWFRRRWDESRGDGFDSWGAATYYFEVGGDGWPTRRIEVYDKGPRRRYGPEQEQDGHGQLGLVRLDEFEDWTQWAIAQEDFEKKVWSADE